jgi:hypothetical protein
VAVDLGEERPQVSQVVGELIGGSLRQGFQRLGDGGSQLVTPVVVLPRHRRLLLVVQPSIGASSSRLQGFERLDVSISARTDTCPRKAWSESVDQSTTRGCYPWQRG